MEIKLAIMCGAVGPASLLLVYRWVGRSERPSFIRSMTTFGQEEISAGNAFINFILRQQITPAR
jgi:hypothetical protein